MADLLVSSSTDGSIRLWDISSGMMILSDEIYIIALHIRFSLMSIIGQQIYGYKFAAQALFYDNLRDILFCGTNEGVLASAKVCCSN